MITLIAPRRQGVSLYGLNGLRDNFNPALPYAAVQNFLDIQADPGVQSRVLDITSSGSVGNYSSYPVYNEYSSGRVWVDIGLSYPKLQEIVPTTATTTSAPPPSQSECPCNNCHEETVIETWYASKEQTSSGDIPVNMTSEVVICEPTDNSAPRPLCAADLAALNAQGINGLGYVAPIFSSKQKKCFDSCSGLPEKEWNKCMSRCNSHQSQSLADFTFSSPSNGKYQQNITFTGLTSNPVNSSGARTADSAWGKCVAGCNSQRLSQNELQKCYAACGTSGTTSVVNSGYAVGPGGNLVALSGLSNDSSVPTDPIIYDNPPVYYTQPTTDCQRGSDNVLGFVVVGLGGAIIGGLIVKALTKTR